MLTVILSLPHVFIAVPPSLPPSLLPIICIFLNSLFVSSDFFSVLSLQLLKLLHNYKDHFHFYCLSTVHIYDLYNMHIILFVSITQGNSHCPPYLYNTFAT